MQGVGFDIGCGNMAVRLDTTFSRIESNVEHAGSIKVQHTPRPFAVAMAGENEFDPFKD